MGKDGDIERARRARPGIRQRMATVVTGLAVIAAAVTVGALPAGAWKPYTHNWAADTAYGDAIDDGMITVEGRDYPVDPELVAALRDHPAHYNAGVVGPDAFPDLIMGQSVIHPTDTGAWLAWVLQKGWAAQTDGGYTVEERRQILAFTYGYLTHAAGDVWAHTFVNEFADGVFPGVGDIASDPAEAAIALRHIIVEGYVGDATPGFDGNPNRTLIPGEVNEDGDPQYSSDSTPDIEFAPPPDRFLWETFIERPKSGRQYLNQPMPGQPSAARGALIEAFYELHGALVTTAGDNPRSVGAAVACVGGFVLSCKYDLLAPNPARTAIETYANEWALDVEYGLQHWSEIGMTFAALFDPGAIRAAQDDECQETGGLGSPETGAARAACEDAIGGLDAAFWYALDNKLLTTTDPALLSMLGAPDFILSGAQALIDFMEAFDLLVDLPNPLADALTNLKEAITEYLTEAISGLLGFDIQTFKDSLTEPATFLDNGKTLPPPLDEIGMLFAPDARERIDALLGLDADSSEPNGRLKDDAELDLETFVPLENTIILSKLVLLGGDQLDQLLSDLTERPVGTYGPSGDLANIMIDGLDGAPWLLSIDSDHQWRADAQPTVTDRPADEHGGTGQMPIWESCVLRPAFGELFTDWQNGEENFPALGDSASPDPTNDPAGPTPSLTRIAGAEYTDDGGRVFVNAANVFVVDAAETTSPAFEREELEVRYRINGGEWQTVALGSELSLTGPDGRYVIEVEAGDPCHTLDESDDLPTEPIVVAEYWLDATPPVLSCPVPPFDTTYETDAVVVIDYGVDDGDGSGVASETSTIDGFEVLPGVTPTADGATVDLYDFYVGERTVEVSMADNLGNAAVDRCSFTVIATVRSITANVDRAVADGDMTRQASNGLLAKLRAAQAAHDRGQHDTEANIMGGFVNEVSAQRGKGIDAALADRLIAAAEDLIAAGR